MSGNVEITGHGAGQLRTLNFKVRSSVSQMAHRVLFLVMFRRTGRFFANFGSFRTRRKNRTFGKWRTCRVVISSGQLRTRRTAEFLTNTQCSSGETRNILLGIAVGCRWQVAFRSTFGPSESVTIQPRTSPCKAGSPRGSDFPFLRGSRTALPAHSIRPPPRDELSATPTKIIPVGVLFKLSNCQMYVHVF